MSGAALPRAHSAAGFGRLGRRWPGLIAAMAITVLFTAASYPGFMSFDSVEALRQARGSVDGSQYPPFGSYIWRVLDWVWPGPTLMQLVQNGLLLCSFVLVLQTLRWPVFAQIAALVLFALVPPLTGTMLVVWKDVAVAAFYLAGFAVLFFARQRDANRRAGLILIAIFLVFCGMAYRFNAASGAFPLIAYAIWLMRPSDTSARDFAVASLLGFALLLVLFAGVWTVNSYRFPAFERLARNTNMDSIMRFDLVGISKFSGESMIIGEGGSPVDVAYLGKIYDPRHLNLTSMNDSEKRLPVDAAEIAGAWRRAIAAHPWAYLKHRGEVFREYIGLHRHEVFYVTHPAVDKNELGVEHTPNALTKQAIAYVWQFRQSLVDRAWVYYAAGFSALALLFASRVKRYRAEAAVLLSSGLLYLAPMYLITPAGDLRYNFWSIWGSLLCIVFALSALMSGRGAFSREAQPPM